MNSKKATVESGLNVLLYIFIGFIALMVIALLIIYWKDKGIEQIFNIHNQANDFIGNAKIN